MAQFPAIPLWTDAYLADTRHLTAAQHGAYLLLLMTAWRTTDCTLPNDDTYLARYAAMDMRTWMKNKDVVMSFWNLVEIDGVKKFRQGRLFDERKFAEHKRNQSMQAGRASALKRKERHSTDVQRSVNETSTPTPTPTPTDISNDISIGKKRLEKPDNVSVIVWDDFLKHRTAKKAPVTETVIKGIQREADKIGWSLEQALSETCARGWQGFKSAWVLRDQGVADEKISTNMKNLKDIHQNGW